jgi:iron complex transport system substrate-binding protein
MTAQKNTLGKGLFAAVIILVAATVTLGIYLRRSVRTDTVTAKPKNEPQRIVSLAPNITEILFELGLGDKVIAVSDDSDWPEQAKELRKIGAFFRPNTEAVIECEPDLVITLWFLEQKSVADSLNRLGYNVLTVELQRLEQLSAAIEEIGKTTGAETAAEKLIEKIDAQLVQIEKKYDSPTRPKVLWVIQDEPVRVAGQKTFINELIELAGGQNAIRPTLMQYPQIGSENILTSKADVIIHSAMSKNDIIKEQRAAEEFWQKYPLLPAVKNKRIYVVDPDTTLRLGPRLPEGVELIAELLHKNK